MRCSPRSTTTSTPARRSARWSAARARPAARADRRSGISRAKCLASFESDRAPHRDPREARARRHWAGNMAVPVGAAAQAMLRPAARTHRARVRRRRRDARDRARIPDAARWILEHFSASRRDRGTGSRPAARADPPGREPSRPHRCDGRSSPRSIGRDVRIVAADYPFLRAMRGLGPRLIFLGSGASQLGWIRAVSRDLRQGGVVLLFPAGRLEPDPAVLGADGALLPWSASVGHHSPSRSRGADRAGGGRGRAFGSRIRASAHTRATQRALDRQRVGDPDSDDRPELRSVTRAHRFWRTHRVELVAAPQFAACDADERAGLGAAVRIGRRCPDARRIPLTTTAA